MTVTARILHAGEAAGPLIRLDAPISFWGGFDPTTGCIIDRAHPQHGLDLSSAIVAMPGSRGSSGTPGVLGEAIRLGTAPAGMILTKADINLVAGAVVAESIYGRPCPILQVRAGDLDALVEGATTTIASNGSIIQDLRES